MWYSVYDPQHMLFAKIEASCDNLGLSTGNRDIPSQPRLPDVPCDEVIEAILFEHQDTWFCHRDFRAKTVDNEPSDSVTAFCFWSTTDFLSVAPGSR